MNERKVLNYKTNVINIFIIQNIIKYKLFSRDKISRKNKSEFKCN